MNIFHSLRTKRFLLLLTLNRLPKSVAKKTMTSRPLKAQNRFPSTTHLLTRKNHQQNLLESNKLTEKRQHFPKHPLVRFGHVTCCYYSRIYFLFCPAVHQPFGHITIHGETRPISRTLCWNRRALYVAASGAWGAKPRVMMIINFDSKHGVDVTYIHTHTHNIRLTVWWLPSSRRLQSDTKLTLNTKGRKSLGPLLVFALRLNELAWIIKLDPIFLLMGLLPPLCFFVVVNVRLVYYNQTQFIYTYDGIARCCRVCFDCPM